MMFAVAKIVSVLANPTLLFFLGVGMGTGLLWTRWSRVGRGLLTVVTVGALLAAQLPVGRWLVVVLEDRFPPPADLPAHVDGIVTLGGFVDPVVSAARGQASLNGAAERLTAFVGLARRYPHARLVVSGGSGRLLRPEAREAPVVATLLDELGIAPSRVVVEAESRDTFENAVQSRRMVSPAPGEVWILITSAIHMPRAVGAFRAVGWPVVPYPVDYGTDGANGWAPTVDVVGALSQWGAALHEGIGLVTYRLRGRSDSVFPGPLP